MIRIKRIYDPAGPEDGFRVLVDRLWPRGLTKSEAAVDLWLKEVAPSTELRRWYHHEPDRWEEFRRRYGEELRDKEDELAMLRRKGRDGRVTLLYAAKDGERNNAVALMDHLKAG